MIELKNQKIKTFIKGTSDSLYQTLIEKSNDAILVVSGAIIVYANQVTTTLCGYEKSEELIGKNALDFISPRYREHFTERIKSRLEGVPQPERFDHEIMRKDGSIVQIETTASLVEYDGRPAVLFIGRDITERKNFESKLFALHRYAAQLGAAQTLVEVSEPTLNAITSVMGFTLANFMLREDDYLGCVHSIGFDIPYWNIPIAGEVGISRAARETKTVLVDDADSGIDIRLLQWGVQSELSTPVSIKGRVEAVISVESKTRGAFTDSDAYILEIIAQHAETALKRIDFN